MTSLDLFVMAYTFYSVQGIQIIDIACKYVSDVVTFLNDGE